MGKLHNRDGDSKWHLRIKESKQRGIDSQLPQIIKDGEGNQSAISREENENGCDLELIHRT